MTPAELRAENDALRARLRSLFLLAISESHGSSVEPALQAAAAHPLVGPVLAHVTARRLEYLGAQFLALGLPADAARHRALLAYTAYLGHVQLAHATPAAAPDDLDAYADAAIATLAPPD